MIEIIFIILIILYFTVASKVDGWQTLVRLGMWTETPTAYNRSDFIYRATSVLLFGITFVVSIFSEHVFWLMIALGIVWILAGYKGRMDGFKKYRQILQEMIESAESEEEKDSYKKQLQKTNSELLAEL